MNNIIRRKMLLGLAAASTAAATGTHASERVIRENPKLVALGDDTLSLQEGYLAARAECMMIADEYASKWPLAPEPILAFGSGCAPEGDLTGASISRIVDERGDFEQVWKYGTPEYFENAIKYHKSRIAHISTTKSKRGLEFEKRWLQRSKEALPLSQKYVAQIAQLREQSGYAAARERQGEALEKLRQHVSEIIKAGASTMEGVLIKAQALVAWSHVDVFDKDVNPEGRRWAESFATTIIAQAEA